MPDAAPKADASKKDKTKKDKNQRPPKRRAPAARSSGSSSLCWWIGCAAALAVSVLSGLAYRYVYPLKQRCPAKDDRFYDHCMEGACVPRARVTLACRQPAASAAAGLALPASRRAAALPDPHRLDLPGAAPERGDARGVRPPVGRRHR
eukprot:3866542-Prymnesium_polylepis.1